MQVSSVAGIDQAIEDAITTKDGFVLVDVKVDPKELLPPSYY